MYWIGLLCYAQCSVRIPSAEPQEPHAIERLLEKLGVGAEAEEVNDVSIYPDKKQIVFDMAFHAPLVLSFQQMRVYSGGIGMSLMSMLAICSNAATFFGNRRICLKSFLNWVVGRSFFISLIQSLMIPRCQRSPSPSLSGPLR